MVGEIKWGTFFGIMLKKMSFHVKSVIVGAVLILVLVSGLFAVLVLASRESVIRESSVGVVLDADDVFSKTLRSLIAEAPEIKDVFDVHFFSENEGTEAMIKGDIDTLFIVPNGYIKSLMDGSNHPILIRHPLDRIGLPTLLIRQLTGACGIYILDTEAGIYAVKDWYAKLGSRMPVDKENELNMIYLNTLLNRKDYIAKEIIETRDGVSKTEYYLSAMAVLWLLLMGLGCCNMIGRKNHALSDRLALYGISYAGQAAGRMISFMILYTIIGAVGIAVPITVFILMTGASMSLLVAMIPVILLASSFICLTYTLIRSTSGGMIFLVLTTLGMCYVSGLFYPLAYLPSVFGDIAKVLPVRFMFDTFISAFRNEGLAGRMAGCFLYAMIFFAVAFIVDLVYSKKNIGTVTA